MEKEIIYLTQEGYEQYLDDIEKLRQKLCKSGKTKSESYVAAVGDGWHDNFAFEEAKREELAILKELEDRLIRLNDIEIIEKNTTDLNVVDIDDMVEITIERKGNMIPKTVMLIGTESRNLNYEEFQQVSINSPLGSAIYGQTVGSKLEYEVNGNKMSVYIDNILTKEKTLCK